jgi:hypothetical protein
MSATVRNIRSFTDNSGPESVRRLVMLGLDSYSLHDQASLGGRAFAAAICPKSIIEEVEV